MKFFLGIATLFVGMNTQASIIGTHTGFEAASGEPCEVVIQQVGKYLNAKMTSQGEEFEMERLKLSELNKKLKRNGVYSKIVERKFKFNLTELNSMSFVNFDNGMLNYIMGIRSVSKRFCNFACEQERTQIFCLIR
jgi:hypothetical protein